MNPIGCIWFLPEAIRVAPPKYGSDIRITRSNLTHNFSIYKLKDFKKAQICDEIGQKAESAMAAKKTRLHARCRPGCPAKIRIGYPNRPIQFALRILIIITAFS
ncbi:hypothetical protein ABFS82_11G035200 [Erythranthe guttata]